MGEAWHEFVFEFKKKHFLLLVDYFSRWIEIRQVSSLSTAAVGEAMKSIFSQNKEGILPVATLSIVLYGSYKSRSSSNFA